MDDFTKIKVVGRGAYGKVYLVKHNFTEKIFAMKAVKKELVIKTDQLEGIKCKYWTCVHFISSAGFYKFLTQNIR